MAAAIGMTTTVDAATVDAAVDVDADGDAATVEDAVSGGGTALAEEAGSSDPAR